MPPSTTRLAPLIKDPSSPETNSTASFQPCHRFTAAGNSCIVYKDIQGAGFFSNLMYFSPFSYLYILVERYFIPLSARIATIFFPSFSGRSASSLAAVSAAAADAPRNTPSDAATSLAVA